VHSTPTTCRDISDVMTLLVDVGQQLARDKAAGTSTGVQEADYARLLEQSAHRMEDLSTAPADPAELQEVAVLFDMVFGFGLENPASEEPFNAAAAAFETSCGYALFS
jgi:NAD(P)H-hydrate repair Nnr-like enzyme with NAD(P)H-hydrate epimerase domain